jgi:hypothetical protein
MCRPSTAALPAEEFQPLGRLLATYFDLFEA